MVSQFCILPYIPVARVLFKRGDDAVEVSELVQLRDVIPGDVRQPARARVVHLILMVHDLRTLDI